MQVGDTVKVSIVIEHGEVPLEDVRLNGGIDDRNHCREREYNGVPVGYEEAIERLDRRRPTRWCSCSRPRQEDIEIQVKSISGLIVHESVEDERHTVDVTGCPVGRSRAGQRRGSEGCVS